MPFSINLQTTILQYLVKQGRSVDDSATGGFPASPASLWVSLHTADPTAQFGAAMSNECAGNGYARQEIAADTNPSTHTNWYDVTVDGDEVSISNKVDITYPTATGSWMNLAYITHFGLWADELLSTEEFYLASGVLTVPVVIRIGDVFRFSAEGPSGPGNLVIKGVA